jgi:tRNA-specific 2-thiouridylase
MKAFLKQYIETEKGDVLDINGEVIGKHDGSVLYTIGERHGFTFHTKNTENEPHFVIAKDTQSNTITVAPKSALAKGASESNLSNLSTASNLFNFTQKSTQLVAISFSQDIQKYLGKKIHCRIRYRQDKQLCTLNFDKNLTTNPSVFTVEFDNPQKDMAEGQSAVLYDGDTCLGGGIISFI